MWSLGHTELSVPARHLGGISTRQQGIWVCSLQEKPCMFGSQPHADVRDQWNA